MPQVFKIAGYWVYFWSDEGKPSLSTSISQKEGHLQMPQKFGLRARENVS